MIKVTSCLKLIVLTGLLLIASTGARAALVNFELTGDVQAAIGNPYGLSVGDTILASGTFDDSVLMGGTGTVSFADMTNNMSISVGSATFTDDMVTVDAQLTLDNGAFIGLDYTSTEFDGFVSIISTFTGSNDTLAGSWDAASLQVTPVPVPAALWLMGSGLLGLAGVLRRKQK